MKSSQSQTMQQTLQEAEQYLTYLNTDENIQPDFEKLQRYLTALRPHIQGSGASPKLLGVVARLYFESMRYQESAQVLQRLQNDPIYNDMRSTIDYFNAYYTSIHDWAKRQAEIWKAFSSLESGLVPDPARCSTVIMELKGHWDACFPTDFLMVAPPDGGDPGQMYLGSPHGIYSLVPMLYLIRHAPRAVLRRWNLILEDSGLGMEGGNFNGQMVYTRDILIRLVPSTVSTVGTKLDLLAWHPVLAEEAARGNGESALIYVRQLIQTSISLATLSFYVGEIRLTEDAPDPEDAVPLPALKRWFRERHMALDIPPEKIMERRRQSFTRTPTEVSRPRADILRGETCMPELEEIYFLQNGKGMAAFQRYGVGYWFLTVPRKVCGDDFSDFRTKLEAHVRKEQGDKVFFTGWAEGTRNCYIDFLAMEGIPMMHMLMAYCDTLPHGKDVRICSFYWNSPLRTTNYLRESEKNMEIEIRAMFNPAAVPPPKKLVSEQDRAVLEKAFRETRWAGPAGIAQPKLAEVPAAEEKAPSPYAEAKAILQQARNYVMRCNAVGAPYDFAKLDQWLTKTLPRDDAPDADEAFCSGLATLLLSAERYRESAKWMSRCAPADSRLVHLYSCDIGSDYPNSFHTWETRRQDFWKFFQGAESGLLQFLSGSGSADALASLLVQLDIAFPAGEVSLRPPLMTKKYSLVTGLPDGILTLPAMLYFTSHYPGGVGKRWNIAVSGEGIPDRLVPVCGEMVPAAEVRVSLTEGNGKVSLAVWHPRLADIARFNPREARSSAARLVNCALPVSARLLSVEAVDAAGSESADAVSLPVLRQEMQSRGFLPDVPLDALLSRRRYAIHRQAKDTGRPRDDIVQGETCMPELEYIYQRIDENGQSVLERYGLHALSLMIPMALTGGDPAQYRQQLQRRISQAEGDKVFFTGWAEGTKYLYLDLITMDGRSLLEALNEYALGRPEGKRLQLCAFYWDSTPRSWIIQDAQRTLMPDQQGQLVSYAKAHRVPEYPVPDAEAVSAFKASFRPLFTLADFCAPKAPEAPAAAPQKSTAGKKKLSKAQRKAQNSQNGGKNGKKKR